MDRILPYDERGVNGTKRSRVCERVKERTVCNVLRAVKKWIERVITVVGCVRYDTNEKL